LADLDTKKARITEIEETISRTKIEISNLEEDIKDVTVRREKEMRKGGKYEALEKSVKEASHEVVRLKTLIDLKTGSIEEENRRKEKAQQQLLELEKASEAKKEEFEKVQLTYQKLRADFDEQSNEATKKEELLQTLSTGIAAKEGQDNGYMDQLQGIILFSAAIDGRCPTTDYSSCYGAGTSETQD
jgi:structural maintenance of chromosome 2